MRGLTKEMELHELLDLGGKGEAGTEGNLMSILNMIHFCIEMCVERL